MSPQSIRTILLSIITEEADPGILERGIAYAKEGRVLNVRATQSADTLLLHGTVRGAQHYIATLTIDTKRKCITRHDCSCPYNELCKHVIALCVAYTHTLVEPQAQTMSNASPKDSHTKYLDDDFSALRASLEHAGIPSAQLSTSILQTLEEARGGKTPNATDHKPPKPETKHQELTSTTKTAPQRRQLGEQYTAVIILAWDNTISSVRVIPKEEANWAYYAYQPSLHHLLHHGLDKTEVAFIEEIHAYAHEETKRKNKSPDHTDYPRLLEMARDAGVPLVAKHVFDNTVTVLEWRTPTPLQTICTLEERADKSGKYTYHSLCVELPQVSSLRRTSASASETGLITITNSIISLHAIPKALGTILARAICTHGWRTERNYQTAKESLPAKTEFTGVEYTCAPDLLSRLATHTNLTLPAPLPEFVIATHTPKEVILVEHKQDEHKMNILPAIDYGGVALPVSDIVYTPHKYTSRVERRSDPAFGTTHLVRIVSDTIHIAPIDHKLERALFEHIRKVREHIGMSALGRATLRGERKIAEYIETFLPRLEELGYEVRYLTDIPIYQQAEFRAEFDIDADAEHDWLAFDVALYCGEERVTLSDIELFLKSGGTTLVTKDGRNITVTNPETMRKLVTMLGQFRKKEDGTYEGKAYHAPGLEAMSQGSPHYTARVSKEFSRFMKEAKNGKAVKRTPIPPRISKLLRPYQKDGVHWLSFLRSYRFGGILADDMGLGKTLQAITIMSMYAEKGTSLVIAPKTLLYNWEREIRTFAPQLSVTIIDGPPAVRNEKLAHMHEHTIAITSYQTLLKDLPAYEAMKTPFQYVVLDEAQYIKNPRTKQAHAVRKLASEYRLALTGTPLENSVEELWSIFEFLMPGFLGHHAQFQREFGTPIMKHGDNEALTHLRAKVQCFMLRRNKDEVLTELPPKIEQSVVCELSDEQNILYQDVLTRVRNDISSEVKKRGFAGAQMHILAGLTRLRQICNHPALAMGLREKKARAYPSAKLEVCMETVEALRAEKRKVLIFSQFTEMLDIIAYELTQQKILFSYLSGKTRKRGDVVEEFMQDPNITVFLISTKAGGVGLNLTVADAVIIFDPWWNPQVERQAIDRAHRIGQTKHVHVYRLRTRGTIEEKIVALEERKQKLFSAMVGENAELFKKLTWEDVRQLLT